MARSKKPQEAEQSLADAALDTETIGSQTGMEGGLIGSIPPQTDMEPGVADGIPPQTDMESGVADGIPPQTDPELGSADGIPPQTGSELDDFPVGDALGTQSGPEPESGPQTDPAPPLEPAEAGARPQTGFVDGPDGNGQSTPDIPNDLVTGSDAPASGVGSDEAVPAADAPAKKIRMPGRGPRVVSIDAQRSVETDADRLRNDLLDLIESMKGKKILSDTIQGVERPSPSSELSYAVIYHGDFKVIIPVSEAVEEPDDYRNQPKGDVLHYLLNKRLGAEVDYIIKGVDPESGIAVASRLEAMAMKRKEYYFRTDRDGNYQIYEGICAEARVVSVIRAGIFIDLFGAECYIPLKELSYQRWMDAAAHYQPGQRVLVKVLEVDRSDRSRPHITASVKQASENPYEKALQRYSVGSLYVGSVSLVDLTGVFVSLDGGIDCLCSHPKRGRPPRGARVTVRILGMDHDTNRIWGVITHMSTAR